MEDAMQFQIRDDVPANKQIDNLMEWLKSNKPTQVFPI